MKILLLTLFSILISACSDNLQIQTSDLEIAKTKWSKVNANQSYSYSYKRNCFCEFSGKSIKVNIKDNKILSATSDGIELSTVSFLTINEHFTQISDFLKEKEEGSLFIQVEYDAKYGYPTTISTESIPFTLAEVVKETIYDISFYNNKSMSKMIKTSFTNQD